MGGTRAAFDDEIVQQGGGSRVYELGPNAGFLAGQQISSLQTDAQAVRFTKKSPVGHLHQFFQRERSKMIPVASEQTQQKRPHRDRISNVGSPPAAVLLPAHRPPRPRPHSA